MTKDKSKNDPAQPPFIINDKVSQEEQPAIPEVVYIEDGFVPTVEQAKAKNIKVTPHDLIIGGGRRGKETDTVFLKRMAGAYQKALELAGQMIIGHQLVLEGAITALVSQGHCLLSGAPGMAKKTLVRTLAQLFGLGFRSISMTSDLPPTELTQFDMRVENGKKIPDGPLFANILLIEEIDRAQIRTQSVLLNAIENEYVTVETGQPQIPLPKPFFVVATKTPVEHESIAPLTASQLDRFMMKLVVEYPTFDEEIQLARCTVTKVAPIITPVMLPNDLLRLQELIPQTQVDDDVAEFAVTMVRKTRVADPSETYKFVPQQVVLGAGTRSLQMLLRAAQARAVLSGRLKVTKNDVRFVSKPVLRHRLVMQPDASLSPDDVIEHLD